MTLSLARATSHWCANRPLIVDFSSQLVPAYLP